MTAINLFEAKDYQNRKLHSVRDTLVFGVESALLRLREQYEDLTPEEYDWEPFTEAEQQADLLLPSEERRIWRLGEQKGVFTYDYADTTRKPDPFTTIAWLMNHIAQTADMYLYCIKSGKPAGEERFWWDLPVYQTLPEMREYGYRTFLDVKAYLLSLKDDTAEDELNQLTPAPWGEMRPTFFNLWGGVIEHATLHAMQIAVRKERIRAGY